MALLYLEFPRLSASLGLPDALVAEFRRNFSFAIRSEPPGRLHHEYEVRLDASHAHLARDGRPLATFADPVELMFSLEEEIENALLAHRGNWVGLHAGAVTLRDTAIVVVGRPDTGKTTTTFQLVELGLDLLCEEVTLVDPETGRVQPHPQVLTLDRHYADAFRSRYPLTGGTLGCHGLQMARYVAARTRTDAAPLGVILFPAFDPHGEPALEEVGPGQILTDLFQHCFPPNLGDERLFDDVIRLIARCRLFTLRTCSIESARALLLELIATLR